MKFKSFTVALGACLAFTFASLLSTSASASECTASVATANSTASLAADAHSDPRAVPASPGHQKRCKKDGKACKKGKNCKAKNCKKAPGGEHPGEEAPGGEHDHDAPGGEHPEQGAPGGEHPGSSAPESTTDAAA